MWAYYPPGQTVVNQQIIFVSASGKTDVISARLVFECSALTAFVADAEPVDSIVETQRHTLVTTGSGVMFLEMMSQLEAG
jgi:hypothetical protein